MFSRRSSYCPSHVYTTILSSISNGVHYHLNSDLLRTLPTNIRQRSKHSSGVSHEWRSFKKLDICIDTWKNVHTIRSFNKKFSRWPSVWHVTPSLLTTTPRLFSREWVFYFTNLQIVLFSEVTYPKTNPRDDKFLWFPVRLRLWNSKTETFALITLYSSGLFNLN